MSLETLIQTYGYPALLIGTFLEGETILVLAGFAAHQGYMSLHWVILCAFIATFTSDQLFFLLGRRRGRSFIDRRPTWQVRAAKVQSLLERYQVYVVLGFRFFYGLRNVTPFVIGASGFSSRRFCILNLLGAALWSVVVGTAGYLFGHLAKTLLDDVKKHEIWLLLSMALVGFVIWIVCVIRLRRLKTQAGLKPAIDVRPDKAV